MTTDEIIAALVSLPGCTRWQMQAECHDRDYCREHSITAWFGSISHTGATTNSLEDAFQELLKVIEASLEPTRGLLAALDELSSHLPRLGL